MNSQVIRQDEIDIDVADRITNPSAIEVSTSKSASNRETKNRLDDLDVKPVIPNANYFNIFDYVR